MILDALALDSVELERRAGWTIKAEGLCRNERCVPLPAGALEERLAQRRAPDRRGELLPAARAVKNV